ncbi:hypothetical protein [Aquimarina macrocephali]|uniref:hypothetical protein n=1 Tax=Aquimarina macrocephali TaxID=666563 RepID=UPI003F679E1F
MAITESIQVSYQFLEGNRILQTNESIKTKIYISTLQTIGFYSAYFRLQYDIKGKLNVGSEFPKSIQLEGQRTWSKDRVYEYEIEFNIPNSPISFSGENLEIVWYLILELKLDDNTKSELRTQLLKNTELLRLIKSYDGKIIEKQRVLISNYNSNYEISDFKEISHHTAYIPILFGIFIIGGTALFYLSGAYGFFSFIVGGIGISALGYGLYKYISIGILGKVQIKGEPINREHFRVFILPEKNHRKIIGIAIFYTINEEVIDNRGTSSTTYRKQIFQSKRFIINPPFQNHILKEITYPKKGLPTFFKYNSTRIFWQLHIEFKFRNGTSYTLKQEFKVF